MITKQYRQGEQAVHTFQGTAPTTRADGTPLSEGEIDHYVRTVVNPDETVEYMDVFLTAGSFSEPVRIDAIPAGIYTYSYQTVDTGGRISVPSEQVQLEVLPPLAEPNPPVMVG